MTDDQIYAISDLMHKDFPSMSRTYMFCIARQGLSGLDPKDLVRSVRGSIGRYFCVWSDSFNDELTDSFVRSYKSVK